MKENFMAFLMICFVAILIWAIAFLLSILSTETKPTKVAETKTYDQLSKFGVEIKVVEIDGHQYLYCHGPGFGSICHKADCMQCGETK